MNDRRRLATTVTAAALSLATAAALKGETMTMHAKGAFDVKVLPVAAASGDAGAVARYSLDKLFHGDLEGTSKGEMLAADTTVKGSGGYVAIERVDGTLAGRKGAFALQHLGSMAGGSYELTIKVVPDSGTGELAGIAGSMQILIEPDGKHFYELDYTLPAVP